MRFDKREWLTILLLTVMAFAVRWILLPHIQVLSPDETYYIGMAASMGEGHSYGGFDGHPFEKSTHTEGRRQGQPLIPFLFLLVGKWFRGRWILAAQWTSLTAFLLTVPFFYAAVRQIGSKREAFFSTLFFVLAFFSIEYSIAAMTHSVYNFFICAFFLFALRMLRYGKLSEAFLAGACLFGAYATRVEAFYLFAYLSVLAVAGIAFGSLRRYSRPLALGALSFLLFSLPLWFWIRQTTGIWQLDWDLSERANFFMRNWQLPVSPSNGQWLSWESHLFEMYPLLNIPLRYLKSLIQVLGLLVVWVPIPVWLLIALGILEAGLRGKETSAWLRLLLAICLFHFLFYPLFGPVPRYFSPALMLIFLGVGLGITFIEERIRAAGVSPLARPSRWFWGIMTVLCLFGFLRDYRSLTLSFRKVRPELRRMGEWIRVQESAPRTFLLSDVRPCFYAGPACGRVFTLDQIKISSQPEAALENFLKEQKIDYVIAGKSYIQKFYPQYVFLLKTSPPAFLKMITPAELSNGDSILYRYEAHPK